MVTVKRSPANTVKWVKWAESGGLEWNGGEARGILKVGGVVPGEVNLRWILCSLE